MRAVVFVVLVALAVIAALVGSWGLALSISAVKALLLASEFMELRHAHRLHAVAVGGFVGALTLALMVLASPR